MYPKPWGARINLGGTNVPLKCSPEHNSLAYMCTSILYLQQLKQSSADGSKLSQEASSNHKEEPTDLGLIVHKQGFLVKRGGRVRTWKKRLFVLDSAGLSYYKTEQVCTMCIII